MGPVDSIKELEINLFGETLPSLEQLTQLTRTVNASEKNRMDFAEMVKENASKNGQKVNLASGIGFYILGQYKKAVEKLDNAKDCLEKFIYLGRSSRKLKQFDQSIKHFDNALKNDAETLMVTLEKAQTYTEAKDFESAEKELEKVSNFANVSADYHYQLAKSQEAQGLYTQAVDNYKTALELEPNHQNALFRLAYRADISGDEEAAIDYYKQINAQTPVFVSALINLAMLYEDTGQFKKAEKCINKILESHPNHPRAQLFLKDIQSSQTMFYDEEKEKKKSRKNKILETPISDFELSVRSRNCLQKMNIKTLGDLLKISEAELLSYKNFGETSLKEIKSILEPRGLHLGMNLNDEKFGEENQNQQDNQQEHDNEILNKTRDELPLSIRAKKCLERLNVQTLGDLTRKTEAELLGCKNFGVTSLNEIKKVLQNYGLSLRSIE